MSLLENRWLGVVLFALLAFAALATTPLLASFASRSGLECEIASRPGQWLVAIANPKHLAGYSALAALALWAIGRERTWAAVAVTLVISLAVEMEQAVFDAGHCRLRDMLPNIVAAVAGVFVARAALTSSAGTPS